MEYSGSCLCGKVRFTIDAKQPLPFGHCHCQSCRKSHGADFTSATILPEQQLTINAGAESLTSFQSSPHMTRQFCRHCGSRLFVRFVRSTTAGDRVLITVAINALDQLEQWRETAHIYVNHRAPWTNIEDELPKAGENFPAR